jgi:signal peptidase II
MLVLCLSILIVVLDQATKYWISRTFAPGVGFPVIPGLLDFTYVRNTGAAWGMFGGLNAWLTLLSAVVLVLVVVFRRSILTDALIHRIALAFMIGGIVGNLMDRVRLQHVVDFIDFYWGVHHFPAFNMADSAICIGVGLYIISSFRPTERSPASGPDDAA